MEILGEFLADRGNVTQNLGAYKCAEQLPGPNFFFLVIFLARHQADEHMIKLRLGTTPRHRTTGLGHVRIQSSSDVFLAFSRPT